MERLGRKWYCKYKCPTGHLHFNYYFRFKEDWWMCKGISFESCIVTCCRLLLIIFPTVLSIWKFRLNTIQRDQEASCFFFNYYYCWKRDMFIDKCYLFSKHWYIFYQNNANSSDSETLCHLVFDFPGVYVHLSTSLLSLILKSTECHWL